MRKQIDWLAFSFISVISLFIVALSLYHLSCNHFPEAYEEKYITGSYLGLKQATWNVIWAFAQTGLEFTMCIIGIVFSYGILRKFIFSTLFPYFIITMIYLFSCYSGIRLLSEDKWEIVWSLLLVGALLSSLIYSYLLIFKEDASEIS